MDKDFEWGYREPEIGDVGEEVEVGMGYQGRILAAVLPPDMLDRFVCRADGNPKECHHWEIARVRYRLPYAERQAKCGIGVGDYVKVLRVPEHREDGWDSWSVTSIAASVGKVLEVEKVHDKSGFRLKDGHWYPYFVLEKVEKPALPKGRTVGDLADGEVICTDDGKWIQVLPYRDGFYCDIESASENKFQEGWCVFKSACAPGNRPARLLRAPTMGAPAIGETVFRVSNPSERFKVWFVFSGGVERAVVHNGEDYRVFKLADLRVIPE